MTATLSFSTDSKSVYKEELLNELNVQLSGLGVGKVKSVRTPQDEDISRVPLSYELSEIILFIQAAYWSVKLGYTVWEIIEEIRTKIAAQKGVPLKDIPKLLIKKDNGETSTIDSSASNEELEDFFENGEKD